MTIRPEEALNTLHDINRAEQNSAAAYQYQKKAPHLFLWGLIWVVAYGATYVHPSVWTWPVLIVVGCAGSAWMGFRSRCSSGRAASRWGWRYGATFVALYFFFFSFFRIFSPISNPQYGALFPLLVALWYALMGIWTSAYRMAVLGVVVGALSMGAYVWLSQYYLLWMAGVGGGALILGGFWLRKV